MHHNHCDACVATWTCWWQATLCCRPPSMVMVQAGLSTNVAADKLRRTRTTALGTALGTCLGLAETVGIAVPLIMQLGQPPPPQVGCVAQTCARSLDKLSSQCMRCVAPALSNKTAKHRRRSSQQTCQTMQGARNSAILSLVVAAPQLAHAFFGVVYTCGSSA